MKIKKLASILIICFMVFSLTVLGDENITTAITDSGLEDSAFEESEKSNDEIISNIIDKYCGDNIVDDINMPWFYADLGLFYDLNPDIERNKEQDEICVKLLADTAEQSTYPSELAKIIIALRANHYDVKKGKSKKDIGILDKLLTYIEEKDERVTEPYTLPYIMIALKDYLTKEQCDYLLDAAKSSKESWQDTTYGTDGISPMLVALSPYAKDDSVEELINECVLIINEYQSAGKYAESFSPAASTGLIMAGFSVLDINLPEDTPDEENLTDILLSYVSEDNDGFCPTENSFASEQGLRGLLGYKAAASGKKIYDFSNENLKPIYPETKVVKKKSTSGKSVISTSSAAAVKTETTEKKVTEKNTVNTNQDIVIETKPEEKVQFTDIKSSDWFYDAVCFVSKNNIMHGFEDKFSPNDKLSRAMLVTIIYRLENSPKTEYDDRFSDVSRNDWYGDAVSFASKNKIVYGTSENEFSPDEFVTREQFATILKRYIEFMTLKKIETSFDISRFSDNSSVSDYAKDSMAWAIENEIFVGTSGNMLLPLECTTRAEAAAVLQRFSGKDYGKAK